MFAVEQVGYAIFGVGETPEAAKQDAAQWLDAGTNTDKISLIPSPVDGDLRLVRITQALADIVRAHGGNVPYATLPNGTLCTEDKAEAA